MSNYSAVPNSINFILIDLFFFIFSLADKNMNMKYFAAFTSIPGNMNGFKQGNRRSCPLYTGKLVHLSGLREIPM